MKNSIRENGVGFTKMTGAGNDYIYIDWRNPIPEDLSEFSRLVSDRHFGVGSDGLVCLLPPEGDGDLRMRMFNADGSEAQMCGNASRCVGKYAYETGLVRKTEIRMETLAEVKILRLDIDDSDKVRSVTVDMGAPTFIPSEIPATEGAEVRTVRVKDREFRIRPVGMGNPHGVIFVNRETELSDSLVHGYGPLLETAEIWPEKANIEFAKILSPELIEMRVWERGSGETLACGTGACATFAAARRLGLVASEATVRLLGGDLKVIEDPAAGRLLLSGPAEFVATGIFIRPN